MVTLNTDSNIHTLLYVSVIYTIAILCTSFDTIPMIYLQILNKIEIKPDRNQELSSKFYYVKYLRPFNDTAIL